jgi:hypothetical protein
VARLNDWRWTNEPFAVNPVELAIKGEQQSIVSCWVEPWLGFGVSRPVNRRALRGGGSRGASGGAERGTLEAG